MADQPSPSPAAATLALVAKLADPAFDKLRQSDPAQAKQQIGALLTSLGAEVPDNLEDLLRKAPERERYQGILDEITAPKLTDPKTVEDVLNLAPPTVFGIHCSGTKLA